MNGVDVAGLCNYVVSIVHHGGCQSGRLTERRVYLMLPIIFAVAATPLANFAEGAILAASVYLVSRGVRNPIRNKKK